MEYIRSFFFLHTVNSLITHLSGSFHGEIQCIFVGDVLIEFTKILVFQVQPKSEFLNLLKNVGATGSATPGGELFSLSDVSLSLVLLTFWLSTPVFMHSGRICIDLRLSVRPSACL